MFFETPLEKPLLNKKLYIFFGSILIFFISDDVILFFIRFRAKVSSSMSLYVLSKTFWIISWSIPFNFNS